MIEEDQNQVCSNNSGGDEGGVATTRSSSKKLKQKKVPQRGLGVAQLEKIRMEEQQKKDGNNNSSNTLLSSNSSSHHQDATSKLTSFPHANNQKPSKSCLPYSPPSPPPMTPMNLTPQSSIFRARSLPNAENFHLDSIPSLNPINGDGFQVRWPPIPVHGNASFPKMWHTSPHHEFCLDHNKGENSIFLPNLSLPYETSNVSPLPDVLPMSTPQLQPPLSNSLVNVSSMSLSSSSVLNFPIEPPSNQNYFGSYSSLLWPDEDQMMAGMKRSCPFPLDNPPIPKFHSKFAPVVPRPISQSDESTSGGNGGITYNLDSGIPNFRDMPSCSGALREPENSRKMSRSSENGNSQTREFLSLAPPPTTSSNPNSRVKQFCKLDRLPYQGSVEDPPMDSTRQEGSSQKQPSILSFFPPTKLQAAASTSPAPNHRESCNSEAGESIDLNLKL